MSTKPSNRVPEALVASPLFLLKKLGMAAKERSLEAYEEAGVHPYHYAILALLDEGRRDTQGAIADALGYDRGQLVGLLDEMEDNGLVARQRDPDDRRRQIVQMTPLGRKTFVKLTRLAQQLDDEFLAALEEEQRRELHALLVTLAETHVPQCRLT